MKNTPSLRTRPKQVCRILAVVERVNEGRKHETGNGCSNCSNPNQTGKASLQKLKKAPQKNTRFCTHLPRVAAQTISSTMVAEGDQAADSGHFRPPPPYGEILRLKLHRGVPEPMVKFATRPLPNRAKNAIFGKFSFHFRLMKIHEPSTSKRPF